METDVLGLKDAINVTNNLDIFKLLLVYKFSSGRRCALTLCPWTHWINDRTEKWVSYWCLIFTMQLKVHIGEDYVIQPTCFWILTLIASSSLKNWFWRLEGEVSQNINFLVSFLIGNSSGEIKEMSKAIRTLNLPKIIVFW